MSIVQYLFRLPARLFGGKQVPSAIPSIPSEVIQGVEKRLGLFFTAETPELNLCLAQSEEIRADFRISFNAQELLQAFYALENVKISQPTAPSELHLSFPANPDLFWILVEYGKQLVIFHTLNFDLTENQRSLFPLKTSNSKPEPRMIAVEFHPNPATPDNGSIWINGSQHVDQIPKAIWECRINGKPPAREYLRQHPGSPFTPSQMIQYQQILFALSKTVRIRNAMQKLNIKEEPLSIF